ncbi:DMT family transporter [Sporomusa sp.]|uniref:DMT family transporter n=1 Tax=Sporomusa sp. TaxID=2078658 RepID=UPI002C0862CE|nr:DMT family transporter [Sporomusa sp.]HWR41867.1 DMT family transporter [Sporomusa sp.]
MNNNRITMMMIAVIFLWGINVVMIKYLTNYYPPLALAGIRMVLAAAFLLPAVLYPGGWQPVPRAAWGPICGVALFNIFLHQIALSWGIKATSATHATLILALNPLLTTLLASWLVREPLSRNKLLGVVLGLAGVLLIISGKADTVGATLLGDGVMVIAMLAYVFGSLCVKNGTIYAPPLIVTTYSHLVAAPALVLLGLFANPVWVYEGAFEPWPLAILLFSSWFSTALGALLWNTGVHHIGASTASLFLNGQPVVGLFASALFLNEQLVWQHYIALILVLMGVGLGTGALASWRKGT